VSHLSIITYAEIYEGIYYGQDLQHNEAIFLRFLRGVRVLGITRPIARQFALTRGELRAKGLLIPQPDLFIAATAIVHHLTLVTRNRRHFERIEALQLHS